MPGARAGLPAPYRWLASPVTGSELAEAYRANAPFDAHRDDPEFGHRFLPDEARAAGEAMAERTAWRICRDNGWWSAFGKSKGRGKNAWPGCEGTLTMTLTAGSCSDGPLRSSHLYTWQSEAVHAALGRVE